jgi:hypothetical protein
MTPRTARTAQPAVSTGYAARHHDAGPQTWAPTPDARPAAAGHTSADRADHLQHELLMWQRSVGGGATVSPQRAPLPPSTRPPPPRAAPAADQGVAIAATFIDEATAEETQLGEVALSEPHTVASALEAYHGKVPGATPLFDGCMVCVQRAGSTSHTVVDHATSMGLDTALADGDALFIAKMM